MPPADGIPQQEEQDANQVVNTSIQHLQNETKLIYSGPTQRPFSNRPLSRIFKKIRLAEPYFRRISGLAEFLRKLRNSAENTPQHHKFRQQDRQTETMKFKL